ncbi:hypothetical protein ACWEQ4_01045 [Rhodococcus sp. NPDC003994]
MIHILDAIVVSAVLALLFMGVEFLYRYVRRRRGTTPPPPVTFWM